MLSSKSSSYPSVSSWHQHTTPFEATESADQELVRVKAPKISPQNFRAAVGQIFACESTAAIRLFPQVRREAKRSMCNHYIIKSTKKGRGPEDPLQVPTIEARHQPEVRDGRASAVGQIGWPCKPADPLSPAPMLEREWKCQGLEEARSSKDRSAVCRAMQRRTDKGQRIDSMIAKKVAACRRGGPADTCQTTSCTLHHSTASFEQVGLSNGTRVCGRLLGAL